MTDTNAVLGSINIDQLDAILEIIRAAPEHANSDTIADVLETTVREAVDRRFEIQKLAKIAANAVFAETGAEPAASLVDIIVASVWDQVHRAQDPNHHDHDGLLPGLDTGSANDLTLEFANDTSEPVTVDIEHEDYLTGIKYVDIPVAVRHNTDPTVTVDGTDFEPVHVTGVSEGTAQSGVQITDDGGSAAPEREPDEPLVTDVKNPEQLADLLSGIDPPEEAKKPTGITWASAPPKTPDADSGLLASSPVFGVAKPDARHRLESADSAATEPETPA